MAFENEIMESQKCYDNEKYLFGEAQRLKEAEAASERLENIGIKTERLEELDRRFLKEMPVHFENILEKYPEIEGYVTSVKAENLPDGVLARTGPYLNECGEYAGAEIQFSKKFFGKSNYGLKIVDLESDLNWRGERWLAGEGTKGVITHEMAHAMALKINAEDAEIYIGERSDSKFNELQKRYYHNSKIVSLCNDALCNLEISPGNIGREVSTYASGDFGEMFAECISRYETYKNPGRLSTEVHDRYVKLIEERSMEEAS
jgi:hypothetical protein